MFTLRKGHEVKLFPKLCRFERTFSNAYENELMFQKKCKPEMENHTSIISGINSGQTAKKTKYILRKKYFERRQDLVENYICDFCMSKNQLALI